MEKIHNGEDRPCGDRSAKWSHDIAKMVELAFREPPKAAGRTLRSRALLQHVPRLGVPAAPLCSSSGRSRVFDCQSKRWSAPGTGKLPLPSDLVERLLREGLLGFCRKARLCVGWSEATIQTAANNVSALVSSRFVRP
jgi:hypothetical protein